MKGSDVAGRPADTPQGVGRLVDSSQAEDRRMIALVRARPLLYARSTMPVASYYAQVKQLWQEVAAAMDWTVAEVRRKWSHVRNSYSRHLRNEMHGARTGRGRAVSRWYLADEMEFLREHMATDTRGNPYPTYSQSFPSLSPTDVTVESTMQPFLATSWATLPHPEDSSNSQGFSSDENSSYFQFFRGIYNDYQELTATRQRRFRRLCLDLLHRMLDEEEAAGGSQVTSPVNLCTVYDSEPEDQKAGIVQSVEHILPTTA